MKDKNKKQENESTFSAVMFELYDKLGSLLSGTLNYLKDFRMGGGIAAHDSGKGNGGASAGTLFEQAESLILNGRLSRQEAEPVSERIPETPKTESVEAIRRSSGQDPVSGTSFSASRIYSGLPSTAGILPIHSGISGTNSNFTEIALQGKTDLILKTLEEMLNTCGKIADRIEEGLKV